jgi:WD40 repeat protein
MTNLDSRISIINIKNKIIEKTFSLTTYAKCLLLANDDILILGCADNSIKFMNIKNELMEKSLKLHNSKVTRIIKLNDTKTLSCSWDGANLLLDLKSFKETIIGYHCSKVFDIIIFHNYLISAGGDCLIKIWLIDLETTTFTFLNSMSSHKDAVLMLRVLNDKLFSSISKDCTLKIWEISGCFRNIALPSCFFFMCKVVGKNK